QQDAKLWLGYLDRLLLNICGQLEKAGSHYRIVSIAIDGTSSTLLACDKDGRPLAPALMYNDQQALQQAVQIKQFAPLNCAAHGASSSLAKALLLFQQHPETALFCHQADWLASSLTGLYGISDENNCLKLGYDSIDQRWPDWLVNNPQPGLPAYTLPKVVMPGSVITAVKKTMITKYNLAQDCVVVAGTTDSNAAVLAAGANKISDAVTSLGSTLVIKVFSETPLFNPDYGIYSHRLNGHWLVGGASNTGGCVLRQHFSQQQLDEMTPQLRPEKLLELGYYPLPATGERFPVNDSKKQNNTSPRPKDDLDFFQALLEGISHIEAEGYKKLGAPGTTRPGKIFTVGGGSKNPAWMAIRERIIGIPVIAAKN
ncbi:MAG: FGGY-family carbohydrate kinase, partial [Gammaproteobacteria bacterium]|nr:FGGY-family carbohydrate kinase [Gammaproteobacteria bacterium]